MSRPWFRPRRAVSFVAALLLSALPAAAIDRIPETSGFSGYANLGVTYFEVESNYLVGAEPIVFDPVSATRIDSIPSIVWRTFS